MRTKVSLGGLCFLVFVGLTIQLNMPQITQALQSTEEGELAVPPEQVENDQGLGALAEYSFQYVWRGEAKYPLYGNQRYISKFDGDPAVGDLNQDGYLDVVISSAGISPEKIGYVSAISGKDGTEIWEFGPIGGTAPGAPMIEDVNGDELLEVIVGDNTDTLFCLSGPFGSEVWSKEGYRSANSVALFDVNGDGRKDIIIAARDPTGPDKGVTALDGVAGETIWVSQAKNWYKFSPKVCDIDGDGNFEVVTWTGVDPTLIYVTNVADGTLKWNMTALPTTGGQMQGDGLVFDVNSDGVLDFISYAANATGSWVYAYTPDLEALATDKTAPVKILWVKPGADAVGGNNEMVMGDLDGNGIYEFVHVQEVVVGVKCILCRRLTDGEILWNATVTGLWPKFANFALGDYDNDGLPDVAITTAYKSESHTFNVFRGTDGSLLLSIPISSMSGPAIADVNNDGLLEILVSGVAIIDGTPDEGSYVWALPTTATCDEGEIAWGMHLYDHVNSGMLPIPEGAVVVTTILLLGIFVKRWNDLPTRGR